MTEEHIDATWALMTPRMKKEVLRLYRATNPENFQGWEDDFLALTATKPTLVIWGNKDHTFHPTMPKGSMLRRSCTFRRPATGHPSRRPRSAQTQLCSSSLQADVAPLN